MHRHRLDDRYRCWVAELQDVQLVLVMEHVVHLVLHAIQEGVAVEVSSTLLVGHSHILVTVLTVWPVYGHVAQPSPVAVHVLHELWHNVHILLIS